MEVNKMDEANIQEQYASLLLRDGSLSDAVKLKIETGVNLDRKIALEFKHDLGDLSPESKVYTGCILSYLQGTCTAKEVVVAYMCAQTCQLDAALAILKSILEKNQE